MYKQLVAFNAESHPDLRIAPTTDYRFVADQMYVPIVYAEMTDAAREYPIVFLDDSDGVFVLTGTQSGVNAYVTDTGAWRAAYVPALLQSYPLVLVPDPKKMGSFVLVADMASAQINSPEGDSLFIQGQPSLLLQQRLQLLESTKQAELLTQQFVQRLRQLDLLVQQAIRIERDNQVSQLTGIWIVDENKLNNLPDSEFSQLRKQGVLPFIYAHLLSLANLRNGVLAGGFSSLAPDQHTVISEKTPVDLDDGIVRFNF